MLFLLIKVLLKPNEAFSSQHIHDSKAMKERGIHCVIDQDRELRRKSRLAVEEKKTIKDSCVPAVASGEAERKIRN